MPITVNEEKACAAPALGCLETQINKLRFIRARNTRQYLSQVCLPRSREVWDITFLDTTGHVYKRKAIIVRQPFAYSWYRELTSLASESAKHRRDLDQQLQPSYFLARVMRWSSKLIK